MTGIGRLGYGVKIAATSRYQSVTAITLIATIVLVLAALPSRFSSRRSAASDRLRRPSCGALLSRPSHVANYTARNRKVVAETSNAARHRRQPASQSGDTGLCPVNRALPMLRAATGMPPSTGGRCEGMLGAARSQLPPRSARVGAHSTSSSAYKISRGGCRAFNCPLRRTKRRHGGMHRPRIRPRTAIGPEPCRAPSRCGTGRGAVSMVSRLEKRRGVPASSHVCALRPLFPG